MKLTINEIAEIAKVAKSTVSKALNGQKGVSEEKRREILSLAERLNYEPSASAQALASSRTGIIGLLLPHEAGYTLAGSYWSAIITSVAEAANAHGHSLLILAPPAGDDVAGPVETVIRRRNVDGLIIGAERLDPGITARLDAEDIPFVLIGRDPTIKHYSVDVDNRGGSEGLVAHLLASGYGRIACLAGPAEYPYNRERVEGYRLALERAGVSWNSVRHAGYTSEEGRRAVTEILAGHPDLDALFVTAGGEFLLDCIDVLRLPGVAPRRIGLGAFDDYRFFDYLDMPICAIRQPLRDIGGTAALMLFALLAGEAPRPMHRTLDVELVIR